LLRDLALHVLGHPNSVADFESLKFFRLTVHPRIRPHIEGMKSELIKYHTLVKSFKPLDQRIDAKGKDTFVPQCCDWWRCNSADIPHFAFVLRAVLTNAPNSCPPERLFSKFNATFGEDQQRSFGDYLELAMQSQYNKRNVQYVTAEWEPAFLRQAREFLFFPLLPREASK